MAKIVVHSVGSLGDLNPFLLLAEGLISRGHEVKCATLAAYKERLGKANVPFARVRPDLAPDDPNLVESMMDPKKLADVIPRVILSHLEESYCDLEQACSDADLLISGSLAFAAPLVFKKGKLKWVSIYLQPYLLGSIHDPPLPASAPWMRFFPFNHPRVVQAFYRRIVRKFDESSHPWFAFCKQFGYELPSDFYFRADRSPQLQLAAFSEAFARPQPDWPRQCRAVGFIQPSRGTQKLSPGLEDFLRRGEPPFVLTLGSAAVLIGEPFFNVCLKMLETWKTRAVLICGKWAESFRDRARHLEHVHVTESEPYSEIFPRSRAVVHQGGIGTTAEALRAGVPMLVAPFGLDQVDNANRAARLGCGDWVPARELTPRKLERLLRKISANQVRSAARSLGSRLEKENGLEASMTEIEAVLKKD